MQPAKENDERKHTRENIARRWKNDTIKKHDRKVKYHVGAFVRVSRAKDIFEKRYEAKWSKKIFRSHRVLEWRKPLVYELCDLADEVIDGIFCEQELARVKKNLQEEEFIVDRVIKNRRRGSNKQLLVSWRGYPSLILGSQLRV